MLFVHYTVPHQGSESFNRSWLASVPEDFVAGLASAQVSRYENVLKLTAISYLISAYHQEWSDTQDMS